MSDYLTKLAARALAPLPAIQPRQGSLFEPAAAPSGLPASRGLSSPWDEAREEAPKIAPSRDNRRPRVTPAVRHAVEVLPNPPANEMPRQRVEPVAPVMRPAHQGPVTLAAKSPSERAVAATVRMQIAPATSAVDARPTPPRRSAESDPRSERVPSDSCPQEAVSRRPREPRSGDALAEERPDDRNATIRRRASEIAPVRPPFAPTVVAAPPRSETATSRSPSEQAPTRPTIHVTIGRVEVRAIAPPATVPAPSRMAKNAPQLSLEDYLQHRSGDRR